MKAAAGKRSGQVTVVCLLLVVGLVQCSGRGRDASEEDPRSPLDEYIHLRAVNAVLRARTALSTESRSYLILDLPEREVRLELQGVVMTRVPLRAAKLNRHAREISRDTTRIGFCEIPFTLEAERWFEDVPTLALKDSAAVRDRPDTTGTVADRVRKARVLALLRFDRNLVVALDGQLSEGSFLDRIKHWFRGLRRWFRPNSGQWPLFRERRGSVLVELQMEPGQVRSLAPNLTEGTRLVLRF